MYSSAVASIASYFQTDTENTNMVYWTMNESQNWPLTHSLRELQARQRPTSDSVEALKKSLIPVKF